MEEKHSQQPTKSSALKAALLSAFVLPGAGQIFNRQWGKGLFLGLMFLVASLSVLIPLTLIVAGYYIALGSGSVEALEAPIQNLKDMMWSLIVLAIVSLVLYIYSVVDAYKQRQRIDQEQS